MLNALTADSTVLYWLELPTARQPAGAEGRPARGTREAGAAIVATASARTSRSESMAVKAQTATEA